MNWRSRKLLDRVHDLPCTWPLGHNCSEYNGVEPAHSNQIRDGKGKGIKARDYRVAALCHWIHAELDQGRSMTKEERRIGWNEAHRTTIGLLFERGLVKVA